MAKRALGKGLGQLMSGQSVARKPAAPATVPETAPTPKVTPVDFGRGMNTLVGTRAPENETPEQAAPLLPSWFFFAADVLLLAFTVVIWANTDGAIGIGEVLFAVTSTLLGALLAIAGVVRAANSE
jgi:hypothetical protein